MKTVLLLFALVICSASLFSQNEKSPLGINISSPVAWEDNWQFVNIAHHSLAWFPIDAELNWGTWYEAGDLQANSYPQPGTDAILCPIWDSPRAITRDLILTWEGSADVELVNHWSSPQLISSESNRAEIRMSEDRFLFIKFSNTDLSDPLKDIRLVKAEHENLDQTFTPEFLEMLSPFKVYRFMDYMQTNGSVVITPKDYSPDNNLFRSQIPLASMIELSNLQSADPWFCIPLTASDNFVINFINSVCDNLESDKIVYIELSNEVWNGIFAAHRQAADSARALNLTDSENNWEAAPVYYGYRSAQIHDIADSVIKAKGVNLRLKRVIAWQAVNTFFVENYIMPWYSNTAKSATAPDAFAIAPYFGYRLGSPENANEVSTWSADKVVEQTMQGQYLSGQGTIDEAIASLQNYEDLRTQYGVESLIAYEAGQHIVGHGGAENNQALTNLFISANRNDKMYDAYIQYLDAWRKAGGKLCAMFSSHGTYSKWGSWGLKEYIAQTNQSAPKYRACLDFIADNPATWSNSDFTWEDVSVPETKKNDLSISPNPASEVLTLKTPAGYSLIIYNLLGEKLLQIDEVNTPSISLNISGYQNGVYLLKVVRDVTAEHIRFVKE